ncbi:MAG: SAM-dependent methyltransferase [Chloroflexota bacterium]
MYKAVPGNVYFVGAGPGAPDLLTIRARDLIAQANLILYADSLVQAEMTESTAQYEAVVQTSSGLHLDEIMALMIDSTTRGEIVVRLHSGDPSIYGAIHEQMARLDAEGIPYEIVPGIPAALAAAAVAKT